MLKTKETDKALKFRKTDRRTDGQKGQFCYCIQKVTSDLLIYQHLISYFKECKATRLASVLNKTAKNHVHANRYR